MSFSNTKNNSFIKILTTPIQHQISGGTIYNNKIFEYLEKEHFQVSIVMINSLKNFIFETNCHYIVDGILIEENLDIPFLKKYNITFLIHLWPSLHPGLLLAQCHQFQKIEKSVSANFKVIVTGSISFEYITKTLKTSNKNHFMINPGIDKAWIKKKLFPILPRKILYLSNFIEGKGHDKLAQVAHSIGNLPISIDCFGEILSSNYFNDFKKDCEQLKLDNLKYKGCLPHDQVNSLLLNYDLVLHLSDYESFGMSIMEAMAANIPCVITPTGNFEAYKTMGVLGVLNSFDIKFIIPYLKKIVTEKTFYKEHITSLQKLKYTNWEDNLQSIPLILFNL